MSGLFELLLGAFGGCAEDMAERSGGRVEEERFGVRVVFQCFAQHLSRVRVPVTQCHASVSHSVTPSG